MFFPARFWVSTFRMMHLSKQQSGPGQRGFWGAAVIKVDHWHVGIHFGLEEKKFQWIQISVGMFLSFWAEEKPTDYQVAIRW